jgi:hypothetical protein
VKAILIPGVLVSILILNNKTFAADSQTLGGQPIGADHPGITATVPVSPAAQTRPQPALTLRDARQLERYERQREAKIQQLYECMEIEGQEFSQQKYDMYRRQKIAGIALVVTGGTGVISAVGLAFAGLADSLSIGYEEESSGLSEFGVSALAVLTGSAVAFFAGIPLLTVGNRGMKRQRIIERRDEILYPDAFSVNLHLNADPHNNMWGLAARFQF